MGDWSMSFGTTCFGNCALSLTICCLAPMAIYKNAEAVGEPGLPWVFTVGACPCAGGILRQQVAKKVGATEHSCLSCLLWWCIPCVPLIQESKILGTIDHLVPPEFATMEKDARNAK